MLRYGLGKFINRLQRHGATFGDRAQRFLQNGGQAAELVAVGRIVVKFVAIAGGIVPPPVDTLQKFFGDRRRDGAFGQQVLRAVDFGRFESTVVPPLRTIRSDA